MIELNECERFSESRVMKKASRSFLFLICIASMAPLMGYATQGSAENKDQKRGWTNKEIREGARRGEPWALWFYERNPRLRWLAPIRETDRYTTATLEQVRASAQGGDPNAVIALIERFGLGEAMENPKEGLTWILKASEQGYPELQYRLGSIYSFGEYGISENREEAIKWYRKAAEQGHVIAQFDLGMLLLGPRREEGKKWLRAAATQGDNLAADWLFMLGDRSEQDDVEDAKWVRKYAERDWEGTYYDKWRDRLGDMYYFGRGVPQDYAEAAKWYRKVAEAETKRVQAFQEYYKGEGQGTDPITAVDLNEAEAAARFYGNAQVKLGVLLANGQGVQRNKAEAAMWYRRAAEKGVYGAQLAIGLFYSRGEGVPQDFIEAYMWLNLAAAAIEDAAQARDSLLTTMIPQQIAEAQKRSKAFVPLNPFLPADSDEGAAPNASGTGFFISSNGYLLTVAHVVSGSQSIKIGMEQGLLPAKIVKVDAANDVAILKVEGDFSALPLGASRDVKLGASVFTVGFPNVQLQGLTPKLTRGEISSLAGVQDDPRHFQISVPVQPGNSGGALVDMDGNVIGVLVARLDDVAAYEITGSLPQNVNYALKISYVQALLETLPEVSKSLPKPNAKKPPSFEETVKAAEAATVIVLVY
ncbi:MAG: tetratricopeptide repeat-containing serine protease family protein [bacterium]